MKTITIEITAERIAAADQVDEDQWWADPVAAALHARIGAIADIDGDMDGAVTATLSGRDAAIDESREVLEDDCTLVVGLPKIAADWLNARWDSTDPDNPDGRQPGEPFSFELALPDWLCAMVDEAIDEDEPRCRVCGCTEDRACAGGCWWVPDPEQLGELCSSCAQKAPTEAACR